MANSKNVGQVSGLHVGTSAPENVRMIWYDTSTNQCLHKVYNVNTGQWQALDPSIVATTTYSELVTNAQKNGLTIGQHYHITDSPADTLAVAVTTTRVWYSDTLGNIIIDDLGTNKQYHVSSGNLQLDGMTGTFDDTNSLLNFSFSEQTAPDVDTDYVLGKGREGNVWKLVKFKIASWLSTASGNSLTWNGGLYFNFSDALTKTFDKAGGIVSYDAYVQTLNSLNTQISNVSKENQTILSTANSNIENETSSEKIYQKEIPTAPNTSVGAADVAKGDTLFRIVSKIQCWINKLKYATGISLSASFTDYGSLVYVNNGDTVDTALRKLQTLIKSVQSATGGKVTSGFTTKGLSGEWIEEGDTIEEALEKLQYNLINAPQLVKLPDDWESYDTLQKYDPVLAGDTLEVAFSKIQGMLKNVTVVGTLPDTWTTSSASGLPQAGATISGAIAQLTQYLSKIDTTAQLTSFPTDVSGLPATGDTIVQAFSKLTSYLTGATENIRLSGDWTYTGVSGLPVPADTLATAFAKITAYLSGATANIQLPTDWGYTSVSGLPQAGDSLAVAIAKLTRYLSLATTEVTLPSDWKEMDYTGILSYPEAGDTLSSVVQKLTARLRQVGSILYSGIVSYSTATFNGTATAVSQFLREAAQLIFTSSSYQTLVSTDGTIVTASNGDVFATGHYNDTTDSNEYFGIKLRATDTDANVARVSLTANEFSMSSTDMTQYIFHKTKTVLQASVYQPSLYADIDGWDASSLYKQEGNGATTHIYTGAKFMNEGVGSRAYTTALSAQNKGDRQYDFDAAFNRLLVGRLTFNCLEINSSGVAELASMLTLKDANFVSLQSGAFSDSDTPNLYLPFSPPPGTVIIIACMADRTGMGVCTLWSSYESGNYNAIYDKEAGAYLPFTSLGNAPVGQLYMITYVDSTTRRAYSGGGTMIGCWVINVLNPYSLS